ncbi:MAG: KOW domain-containing RNA-binding protein [Armatimonadetes bacterium]|nr:KOW domain-containing RNA-binding protein [Armatimonadota bacterium]
MVSDATTALLGRVVTSRAGRDRGDRYVVVAALGVDMVLVSDGARRGMDRPKKKNVKHLIVHEVAPALAARLAQGETPRDEEIRLALAEAVGAPDAGGERRAAGEAAEA